MPPELKKTELEWRRFSEEQPPKGEPVLVWAWRSYGDDFGFLEKEVIGWYYGSESIPWPDHDFEYWAYLTAPEARDYENYN